MVGLELQGLIKYKDLIYLLIRRDFVTSYKQTILGPLWVLLQSLVGSAVFTVVFGKIANISTDGHPAFLFYLCGMLSWQYFASVYGAGCSALQSNLPIFSKSLFPATNPSCKPSLFSRFQFSGSTCNTFFGKLSFGLSYPESNSGPKLEAFLFPLLFCKSQYSDLVLVLSFL